MQDQEYINETAKQMHSKAAILTVNIRSFTDLMKEIDAKRIFPYVNGILEQLVPIVSANGGVISRFIGAGLNAYYPEQAEQAMRTAMRICEALGETQRYAIGLCHGNIITGMVGYRDNMSVVTISEHIGISEFLQAIAPKYHARVLVTSSFANQIPEFEAHYTYRFLGYIWIKTLNKAEKIYDVFSGDRQEDIWMKKKTRLMFEEGVRLYISNQLEMARLHFIEVLKADREDEAAKEYLYLCDYYLKKEHKAFHKIYIEMF